MRKSQEEMGMMSNVKYDTTSGKYIGTVNGRVVVRSTSQYYVKAKVKEMSGAISEAVSQPSEFSINQRFDFVSQMVNMVAKASMPSVIITGAGGLGKTYTVMKALDKAGMKNITDLAEFAVGTKFNASKCYRMVKGYSTAKGLYRTLFESNGSTIVFDDCDSILKDDVATNLLKGALDSYSKRYISWMADMRDDDLPKSFEFTGRVIFISNRSMDKIDQAIRTRAMCVDLSMTEEQKLERMEVISKSDEFLPEIPLLHKQAAVAFLKTMVGKVSNLSLRSLIAVSKIVNEGGEWKSLAKYVLTQGN